MTNSANNPLYHATNKLISALERLEKNMQHISVSKDRDVQQHQLLQNYQRENAALLEEQVILQKTVANLQQKYNELQDVAAGISKKLDNSIGRLSEILEK